MTKEYDARRNLSLILRSREAASRRMGHGPAWFETRGAALLSMRGY
jgi:hypothetical protein